MRVENRVVRVNRVLKTNTARIELGVEEYAPFSAS